MLRIDAGSSHPLVTHGHVWSPDRYFVGGHQALVAGLARNTVGSTARDGQFGYRIPVPSAGYYKVRLNLAATKIRQASVDVRVPDAGVVARWSVAPLGHEGIVRERFVVAVGASRMLSFSLIGRHAAVSLRWVRVHPIPRPAQPVRPVRNTWLSGVSVSGGTPALAAFAHYRASPVTVVNTYLARSNWNEIATNTWALDQYADFDGQLVLSVPLVPDGAARDLPEVAAGKRDAEFASLARNLVATGRGNAIIRLGWEFNVPGFSWSAYNAPVWVAAFRHVVDAMRAVAPDLTFDWNGNYGQDQTGHSAFKDLYPGNSYVDIVGVDAYDDQWSKVVDESQWQAFRDQPGGLGDWLRFAEAHHKPLSVPEWGLDVTGGGDNAYFIEKMHAFFAQNADQIAFECYFNDAANSIKSSLNGPDQNPRAAASYRSLWSAAS